MGKLTLMAVLAHPDDETLGFGGTLATYAAEGVDVVLVTATRGDAGRYRGKRPGEDGHPGQAELAAMRERELHAAAATLGIRDVTLLDYRDQHLSRADAGRASADIAHHIRRHRPQVVVTFGMDGAYGHPDHIAVSQFTSAAIVDAARPQGEASGDAHAPHVVSKCYHLAWPATTWSAYESVFGELTSTVDGVVRRASPAPEWSLSAVVDATAALPVVLRAAHCHTSQVGTRERLQQVSSEQLAAMWSRQSFYRVFSLVGSGSDRETDLFAGLR
ncbi:MAG: PIG-L family deacetylase [Vicinamibacterales bacterium]